MNKYFSVFIVWTILLSSCGEKNESNPVNRNINQKVINVGKYKVDDINSKLVWKGKQLSSKEHDGTLNLNGGIVTIDESGNISGQIKIDMQSINTTNLEGAWKDKLDGHLKSPDFFSVSNFPNALIKFSGNQNMSNNGEINFEGNLTIKEITHPTKFSAKLNQIGDKVFATGLVSFDRSKYDVRYGSGKFFENLGDKLIYDEITVNVSIVAKMM